MGLFLFKIAVFSVPRREIVAVQVRLNGGSLSMSPVVARELAVKKLPVRKQEIQSDNAKKKILKRIFSPIGKR